MAINNFGPGRCANLIHILVKAWPWEATAKGYDWWVGLCQKIDEQGEVEDDITLQAKEFNNCNFTTAREAVSELGRLLPSVDGDFSDMLTEAETILRNVSNMATGIALEDSSLDKARERAARGSDWMDVTRAVAEVSDFAGAGDVLAAYFFIHQAKHTRQLPPPSKTTALPELDVDAIQQLLKRP